MERRTDLPQKWRPKFVGPLRILEKIGPVAYRLELPPDMKKAHNVFNVDRIRRYTTDDTTAYVNVFVDAKGGIEQEVKAILRHRGPKTRRQFLVHFVEETPNAALWHTRTDLKHCQDLVYEYEKSLATSPRTSSRKRVSATTQH
ncbi:hypothetical protein BWQ96_08809 [Gracilariopsis chorda]|uniref:Chromo domain-containing protein n=1 Tax=Gracilariopsis chorda TaxID=448386 RepID=A0A2V3IHA8_9FLOR|nr:hypothetical protein BWQ96_08809 [Gracilariopsis chorda]|eukprot:PXF41474.1 hypothetical protein BWQ96_08809 [Gracilariopsis chorda]